MTTTREFWSRSVRLLGAAVAMASLLVGGAADARPSGGGGGHSGGGHSSGGHVGGGHAGGGHAGGGLHGGYAGAGHASPAIHGSYGYAHPHAVAGGSYGGAAGGHGGYSAGHGAYAGGHGAYAGGHGGYYGGHGGYYGGAARYYNGYGGHGGYWGWHGGHYGGWHGAWYGGSWYWWGGVYPLGLYFATLPLYYDTFWWGGVPYYYADYTFYRWNDGVREYEVVAPPADVTSDAPPAEAAASEPYVYPRQGQSDEQLKQDRYQCYRWAADQTGFDPTRANGGANAQDAATQAGAYHRAESACLEGRGYTVR